MPQACTRIRTCPAPGLGISRSTISKSAPGFGTCTTFIFAIETLRSSFWICGQNLDARPLGTDTTQGAANKQVFVAGIKISALALPRGTWYKSEEKANTKQTSHAC